MVGPKPIRPVTAKNDLNSTVDKSSKKKKSKVENKPSPAVPKKADTLNSTEDSGKENKPVIPSKEEKVDVSTTDLKKLEQTQIEECVRAFYKLVELEKSEKKALFSSEGEKVQLQISGIKLPRDSERQVLKCRLPHSPMAANGDVCLFVKDLEKGLKVDHEDTVRHFTDLLADKGVKGISQVIALRELKVEYKQYEAKTQLCHRFDKFLADDRIIRLLPQFLGKAFYKRKKLPVQVNLKSKDLPGEISRAVDTVTLPLTNTGSCSAVTVGNSTMGQTELVNNVAKVIKLVEERYPGGWTNVRSVHLLSGSNSIPLYISLRATQEVGKVTGAKISGRSVVIDELSTVPGATVIVTPGGVVRVKRKKDPQWDQDDDLEKNIKDDKEDDEENNSKTKSEKESTDGVKKQKPATPVDEESDDEMEDKEMEYMRKVAEEEEEMENKIEANDEQQAEKLKENSKNESDSEEEDVIDDDAEAENLLSDGDDSDSDDDLVMKAAPVEDLENQDEDEKPAKKKKKKDKGKAEKKKGDKKSATPTQSKKSLKQKKFTEKKKKEKLKSKK